MRTMFGAGLALVVIACAGNRPLGWSADEITQLQVRDTSFRGPPRVIDRRGRAQEAARLRWSASGEQGNAAVLEPKREFLPRNTGKKTSIKKGFIKF